MDDVAVAKLLAEYISGSTSYKTTFHLYLDETWDVYDSEFVKSVDNALAEYVKQYLSEEEFKDRLRNILRPERAAGRAR